MLSKPLKNVFLSDTWYVRYRKVYTALIALVDKIIEIFV